MGAAGSGTSHTHVFPDDPTNTTWYMPDTGSTMTDTSDPVGVTFASQAVNWMNRACNADLSPPVFSAADLTLDEGEAFNCRLSLWTLDTLQRLLIFHSACDMGAGMLFGTAPEVAGDNVANQATPHCGHHQDDSYGSSTGQLTIVVNNLTAPDVAPIAGSRMRLRRHRLFDSDTMDDGSVVAIDNILDDGNDW